MQAIAIDHDFGGRRHGQAERQQQIGQHQQPEGGNQQGNGQAFCHGRPHSNRVMRSPNRPRGRNSNTSSINR